MSNPRLLWKYVYCLTLVVIINQGAAVALTTGEAIEAIAGRLDLDQVKAGQNKGIWPGETGFTGSICVGMVTAYQRTCDPNYKDVADLAVWAMLHNPTAGYGDDAFALSMMSDLQDNPADNQWRTALSNAYYNIERWEPNGTDGYIDYFLYGAEPSTSLFYLANHLVAAYYVDANDKEIWRSTVIDYLARVDDNSAEYPVTALGIATWALARTGELNDTLVDPCGTGELYWDGITLADLPELLSSHQVDNPDPNAGSFYWRFDHRSAGVGGAAGYTEDTIFAVLGLVAAQRSNPALNYEAGLLAARQALANGVAPDGTVYGHLWLEGAPDYYLYAGEMLTALGGLVIDGDLNLDDKVNFVDHSSFGDRWMHTSSLDNCWCNGADIDKSGTVDYIDLAIGVADNWLIRFPE